MERILLLLPLLPLPESELETGAEWSEYGKPERRRRPSLFTFHFFRGIIGV